MSCWNDFTTLETIFREARAGDAGADNRLFAHLHAMLLPLVQKRIYRSGRNVEEQRKDAEDLTQEICVVILLKYRAAKPAAGFTCWVLQIARNKIGDYYRKKKIEMKRLQPLEENDLHSGVVAPLPQIEFSLDRNALLGAIQASGKNMSRTFREILRALLSDEMKAYVANQKKKRIPLNTIYSRIHRCRALLRMELRHAGYRL